MTSPTIVIGGGPNGLVAAAWLARRGRPVVLLEGRDRLGGLAAPVPLGDGAVLPGLLHDTAGFRDWIADTLDLARHGLKRRPEPTPVMAPGRDADPLVLRGDRLEGGAPGDAEAYAELRAWVGRLAPVMCRLTDRPPVAPWSGLWSLLTTGFAVRRLGKRDMIELLRVGPMCVADFMRDRFTSERLSAALALPALEGAFTGPWSAGSAANLLLRECTAETEVEGGPAALIEALTAAARSAGAELRTGARVERIRLGAQGVLGVTLADGEALDASAVIATCGPKQALLGLVGEQRLPSALTQRIRAIRTRGTTAVVQLLLDGPLELACGEAPEALRIGDSLDALERAFDAAKYRRYAQVPALDVRVPSLRTAGLAPEGHQVVSILAHAAPYTLDGGWTEAAREGLGDAVVRALAAHCPALPDRLRARQVFTPTDLERRWGLTGGHLHQGEHAPDQLFFMRPTFDCSGYATPIPGLFLGGSGSHPGGGITGVPGALAAQAVLA